MAGLPYQLERQRIALKRPKPAPAPRPAPRPPPRPTAPAVRHQLPRLSGSGVREMWEREGEPTYGGVRFPRIPQEQPQQAGTQRGIGRAVAPQVIDLTPRLGILPQPIAPPGLQRLPPGLVYGRLRAPTIEEQQQEPGRPFQSVVAEREQRAQLPQPPQPISQLTPDERYRLAIATQQAEQGRVRIAPPQGIGLIPVPPRAPAPYGQIGSVVPNVQQFNRLLQAITPSLQAAVPPALRGVVGAPAAVGQFITQTAPRAIGAGLQAGAKGYGQYLGAVVPAMGQLVSPVTKPIATGVMAVLQGEPLQTLQKEWQYTTEAAAALGWSAYRRPAEQKAQFDALQAKVNQAKWAAESAATGDRWDAFLAYRQAKQDVTSYESGRILANVQALGQEIWRRGNEYQKQHPGLSDVKEIVGSWYHPLWDISMEGGSPKLIPNPKSGLRNVAQRAYEALVTPAEVAQYRTEVPGLVQFGIGFIDLVMLIPGAQIRKGNKLAQATFELAPRPGLTTVQAVDEMMGLRALEREVASKAPGVVAKHTKQVEVLTTQVERVALHADNMEKAAAAAATKAAKNPKSATKATELAALAVAARNQANKAKVALDAIVAKGPTEIVKSGARAAINKAFNPLRVTDAGLHAQIVSETNDTLGMFARDFRKEDWFATLQRWVDNLDDPITSQATMGISQSAPAKRAGAVIDVLFPRGPDGVRDWSQLGKVLDAAPDDPMAGPVALVGWVADAVEQIIPIPLKSIPRRARDWTVRKGSIPLLGWNWPYFVNNSVNDVLTPLVDGVMPFDSFKSLDTFAQRWGILPVAAKAGFGAGGTLQTSAAVREALADLGHVTPLGKIFKGGLLQKRGGFLSVAGWGPSIRPMSDAATIVESLTSERVAVEALRQSFVHTYWPETMTILERELLAAGIPVDVTDDLVRAWRPTLRPSEIRFGTGEVFKKYPLAGAAPPVGPVVPRTPIAPVMPSGRVFVPESIIDDLERNGGDAIAHDAKELFDAASNEAEALAAIKVLEDEVVHARQQQDILGEVQQIKEVVADAAPDPAFAAGWRQQLIEYEKRLHQIERDAALARAERSKATAEAVLGMSPVEAGLVWDKYWTQAKKSLAELHAELDQAKELVGRALGFSDDAIKRGVAIRAEARAALNEAASVTQQAARAARVAKPGVQAGLIWEQRHQHVDNLWQEYYQSLDAYLEEHLADLDEMMGKGPPAALAPEGVPPAPPPPAPPAAPAAGVVPAVEPPLPTWMQDNIRAIGESLTPAVREQIERMAADRKTAAEIAQALGMDRENVLYARAYLGIPSQTIVAPMGAGATVNPDFEVWLRQYQARGAAPALTTPSIVPPPAVPAGPQIGGVPGPQGIPPVPETQINRITRLANEAMGLPTAAEKRIGEPIGALGDPYILNIARQYYPDAIRPDAELRSLGAATQAERDLIEDALRRRAIGEVPPSIAAAGVEQVPVEAAPPPAPAAVPEPLAPAPALPPAARPTLGATYQGALAPLTARPQVNERFILKNPNLPTVEPTWVSYRGGQNGQAVVWDGSGQYTVQEAWLYRSVEPRLPTGPAFGVVAPGMGGAQGPPPWSPLRPASELLDRIIATLRDTGRRVKSTPRTTANLTRDQIAAITRIMEQRAIPFMVKGKQIAGGFATKMRHATLLNYARRTNLHEWLTYPFWYNFWYLGTAKQWAVRLLTSPIYIAQYTRYRQWLLQANREWYKHKTGDPNAEPPEYYTRQVPITTNGGDFGFDLERNLNPLQSVTDDYYDYKRGVVPAVGPFPSGDVMQKVNSFGPTLSPIIIQAYALFLKNNGFDDAAQRWSGYLLPPTQPIKSATALLGEQFPGLGIPSGGLNIEEPFNWAVKGGTIYERGRIPRQLWKLIEMGEITEEQFDEAAKDQSGPIWDKAQQMEAVERAIPNLIRYATGRGFTTRSDVDVKITQLDADWSKLWDARSSMNSEQWRRAMRDFNAKYPWASSYRMGKVLDPDKRLGDYSYIVLDRLPPGDTRTAILNDANLSQDLVSAFYESKGELSQFSAEQFAAWKAGIELVGRTVPVPPPAEYDRFEQARTAERAIEVRVIANLNKLGFTQDLGIAGTTGVDLARVPYQVRRQQRGNLRFGDVDLDYIRRVEADYYANHADEEMPAVLSAWYKAKNALEWANPLTNEFYQLTRQAPPGSAWRDNLTLPAVVETYLDFTKRQLMGLDALRTAAAWLKANVPVEYQNPVEWGPVSEKRGEIDEQARQAGGYATVQAFYDEQTAYYTEKDKSPEAAKAYLAAHPGLEVAWDKRSELGMAAGPVYAKYYPPSTGDYPPGSAWRKGLTFPPMVQMYLDDPAFRDTATTAQKKQVTEWLAANVPAQYMDKAEWAQVWDEAERINTTAAAQAGYTVPQPILADVPIVQPETFRKLTYPEGIGAPLPQPPHLVSQLTSSERYQYIADLIGIADSDPSPDRRAQAGRQLTELGFTPGPQAAVSPVLTPHTALETALAEQSGYFDIPKANKAGRKAYLVAHPKLKAFWDAKTVLARTASAAYKKFFPPSAGWVDYPPGSAWREGLTIPSMVQRYLDDPAFRNAATEAQVKQVTNWLAVNVPVQYRDKAEWAQVTAKRKDIDAQATRAGGYATVDAFYAEQTAYYAEKEKSAAAGRAYLAAHPGLEVAWSKRSELGVEAGPVYAKYYPPSGGGDYPPGSAWREGLTIPPMVQMYLDDQSFRDTASDAQKQQVMDWLAVNVPAQYRDKTEWTQAWADKDRIDSTAATQAGYVTLEAAQAEQAAYYVEKDKSPAAAKAYLAAHPMLKAFWDARSELAKTASAAYQKFFPPSGGRLTVRNFDWGNWGGGYRRGYGGYGGPPPVAPLPATWQNISELDFTRRYQERQNVDPGFSGMVTMLFGASFWALYWLWLRMTPEQRRAWEQANPNDYKQIGLFMTWFSMQEQAYPATSATAAASALPTPPPVPSAVATGASI